MRNIEEFAIACVRVDWTAPFSDDHRCWRRFEDEKTNMKAEAAGDKNKTRLWDLAYGFLARFTWWVADDNPERDTIIEDRWEAGWRWYGAYVWARGWRDVTEADIKALLDNEREIGKFNDRTFAKPLNYREFEETIENKTLEYKEKTLYAGVDVDACRAVDRDAENRNG